MVDSAMRTIHTTLRSSAAAWSEPGRPISCASAATSVAVIEKGAVGSQASGVNFGNVRLEGRHPTEFPLALRAMEQWEQIEELIGERCEFTPCGHSYIALDPKELPRLERYQREGTAGGLEIELLGANDVRRRFPYARSGCLRRDVVASATAPPIRGLRRPQSRVRRARSGRDFPNTRVVAIEAAGERFRVVTDRELAVEAPFVVNAAGAWGNEIAEQFGETTPMFPAAPPNFVTEPLPLFHHIGAAGRPTAR